MTQKGDWFHEGWAFHFKKWFGFNDDQADYAVHAMVSACAAICLLSIPLIFWKLIGLLCLSCSIWLASRVYALRTIRPFAAGNLGTATPSKQSRSSSKPGPAADTSRRKSS